MTKILSKAAPILGAGAGFLLGGPSGAALGLGLGSAAGGLVAGTPSTGQSGSGGLNPAAFQPITAEGLDPFLSRLNPPPAGQTPGIGHNNPPGNIPQLAKTGKDYANFVAGLADKGVDVSKDLHLNPEFAAFAAADFEATAPIRAAQQRQYEEQGFVGPSDWMGAPQAGGGGVGGAPSIANPGINGGTPAFNVAGGVLSKTNSVVQQEFARRFPEQLAALDQLRAQVAPNVSLARKAALGQVEDQGRVAQGNLRQQLARRGVSGSSFGQSAQAQQSAEFAKQAAQVEVQAAQQELELTTKFIDMQRSFMAEALSRDLTELGFGTELAIASGRMATDIANIQAQLAAAELQAKTQLNVANITAEASRFASTSGIVSQRIASDASTANAELSARGGIIQSAIGANSENLRSQIGAQISQNELSQARRTGTLEFFGNLAGLGLNSFLGGGGGFGNIGSSSSGFNSLPGFANLSTPNFGSNFRIGG